MKSNPHYKLKVKQRNGAVGETEVGRAWVNDDHSLSIQLNPCVVLSWRDDVYITAFPIEYKEKKTDAPNQ